MQTYQKPRTGYTAQLHATLYKSDFYSCQKNKVRSFNMLFKQTQTPIFFTNFLLLVVLVITITQCLSQPKVMANSLKGQGIFRKDVKGVEIQVKDQMLSDVLISLGRASGVKFSLAQHLGTEKITGAVLQPTWAKAIRALLANYSTVEMGEGPLIKVMILDKVGDHVIGKTATKNLPSLTEKTGSKSGMAYRPVKRIKKKIWAKEVIPFTQEQLKLLVGDGIRSPIPKRAYQNPVYREIFKRHKISKPQLLTHLPTIMPLKIEAGKLLRVLQKRNR